MPPAVSTSLSLAGLKALVIGGSSGIGEAAAQGFAEAGAQVAIAARRRDKLDAALSRLSERTEGARAYMADVTSEGDLRDLADRVLSDFGQIDVLINCQGTTILKPAIDFSSAEFAHVIATNLTSVFSCCATFGRAMIAQESG